MSKLVVLELNEINMDLLRRYADDGALPRFRKLFEQHGLCRTESETAHANANPWIQWVTAHTGQEFSEHGVFRMGDIVHHEIPQIWETLEARGHTVAALSPFNANNRCQAPAFFIPDPWTQTAVSGPWSVRQIFKALVQVADDYANERIALSSVLRLLAGGLRNLRWRNLPAYLRDTWNYLFGKQRWARALVCDRLLVDTFVTQWRRSRPDYATLCLNAGAHLQHHYMVSSRYYEGPRKNPEWYVPAGVDPVEQAYRLYDELLGTFLDLGARVMLVTGLAQVPHERESYYYRMNEHSQVLDALGIRYQRIHPLMTEDFVVYCESPEAAKATQQRLETTITVDEDALFYVDNADVEVRRDITSAQVFYVDNRGSDLYVQLKPTAREIGQNLTLACGDRRLENFERYVDFVQIKNGHHVGTGYFTDSGLAKAQLPDSIRLASLRKRMEAAVTNTEALETSQTAAATS